MRVEALERDRHRVGGEALPLELAGVAAIHRVGAQGAEPSDVEEVRAAADLLVGRERHPDRAVRNLGMGHQVLGGGDDLGHARLVVGAEQRVPDAVTMSWPTCAASDGSSAARSTAVGSSGSTRSRPS